MRAQSSVSWNRVYSVLFICLGIAPWSRWKWSSWSFAIARLSRPHFFHCEFAIFVGVQGVDADAGVVIGVGGRDQRGIKRLDNTGNECIAPIIAQFRPDRFRCHIVEARTMMLIGLRHASQRFLPTEKFGIFDRAIAIACARPVHQYNADSF